MKEVGFPQVGGRLLLKVGPGQGDSAAQEETGGHQIREKRKRHYVTSMPMQPRRGSRVHVPGQESWTPGIFQFRFRGGSLDKSLWPQRSGGRADPSSLCSSQRQSPYCQAFSRDERIPTAQQGRDRSSRQGPESCPAGSPYLFYQVSTE